MEKKVSGVTLDTTLKKDDEKRKSDDIHEIKYNDADYGMGDSQNMMPESEEDNGAQQFNFEKIQIRSTHQVMPQEEDADSEAFEVEEFTHTETDSRKPKDHGNGMESLLGTYSAEAGYGANLTFGAGLNADTNRTAEVDFDTEANNTAEADFNAEANHTVKADLTANTNTPAKADIAAKTDITVSADTIQTKPYKFPPINLLNKGKNTAGDSSGELRETAMRLQQTLNNFGVKVTITDISQGPSVTRYELQPEQGVKVSKIVSLTDDIKLNLAATDIRIEAPIPGKAAIGIEVPNKENTMVALRDLLESKEYNDFNSNLAFAVGKDIAGKVVVADIAKMPHMLIAGSTGSGKSVCINTLIMSIIYKAHPDDVKLIMIDPKVVELSVYNGIPHLLLDVVTDPKKASAALHWGVTEMEDRYRRLADFNVRDLKEYNKKVEAMKASGDVNAPAKMPQIVIIVDELADLMMVAPGEVEESICRLAQLARAAGIHLVIATQRPSVDVITGLIKANMPSRVAFAVSSGVDSRTILDMNGAEKLLGKGDMLFYPQGYSKPARIQGAFVSDSEVSNVVDFLKNQRLGNNYAQDIEEKLSTMGSSTGGSGGNDSANSRDEYFEQAGRFIIDKDKASIGMLQRVLKIGFNRAARIMDQLCDYGVVGEEEGTKPRKVLMSIEQFEQLLEEI
jgi:S-DNA-T family DNA segregation ATPase FtsK/SpoIIIE